MGNAAQLVTSAVAKLLSGFRPSTLHQYRRMWMDFIAFQVAAGLLDYQVTVKLLLSFFEYLHQNHISSGQLQNYLSAIRAMHIVNGLKTAAFKDERLSLFLKASRIHRPFRPRVLAHLDISLLDIVKQCDQFQFPVVYKPLYLLMFFFLFLDCQMFCLILLPNSITLDIWQELMSFLGTLGPFY